MTAVDAGRRILLLSEDHELGQFISSALDEHAVTLSRESDVERGLAYSAAQQCSLVMVDAATKSLAPLGEIRRRASIPMMVIAVDGDPAEAARLIDSGADDCVGRPVHRENLVARVRALLRRSPPVLPSPQPVCVGDLRIDPARRTIAVHGDVIRCTAIEFDILEYLARRAGTVVPREELLGAVCGRNSSPLDRAVDVHISHMRRKLRPRGQRIVTVRGVGYLLAPPDAVKA